MQAIAAIHQICYNYSVKHARIRKMSNENNREKVDSESKSFQKTEKVDVAATADLLTTQAEVAGEVADLGIEDGESFSEGESQTKGKQSAAASKQDDIAQTKSHIQPLPIPVVMQKEVASEIRKEIRKEERKVLLVYAGVKKLPPHKLAEVVARIRNLKNVLASLASATKEILTSLYLKWVRKEG